MAGVCQGPKDIPDTVAQASAVAAGALKSIAVGRGLDSRSSLSLSDIEARAARPRQGAEGRTDMAIRANPKLIDELELYGAQDVSKCYHCGNCSAACPLLKGAVHLPAQVRCDSLQMGLEAKLESHLEPWLCYYCGECSQECPRDAEPGETMMSLRRWLTARYDWTGISRLFYRSWKFELLAVLIVGLLSGAGFLLWGFSNGSISQYNGADAFLPASGVHIFDWTLACVLLALLLSNCARMWWFTIGRDEKVHVPASLYIKRAYLAPAHFITQMRYARCESKRPWALHLVLMLSYVTMLILIMFFLALMWAGPAIDWWVHPLVSRPPPACW